MLQVEMVGRIAIILSAWLWIIWCMIVTLHEVRVDLTYLTIAELAICLFIWRQAHRRLQTAIIMLIILSMIGVAARLWLFELSQIGYFFVVPVLLSSIMLHWQGMLPVTAAAIALILFNGTTPLVDRYLQTALITMIALIQTSTLAIMRVHLEGAWRISTQVTGLVQQARKLPTPDPGR